MTDDTPQGKDPGTARDGGPAGEGKADKAARRAEIRARRDAERKARRAEIRAQRQAERQARKLAPLPVVEVASPPQRRRLEAAQWVGIAGFLLLVLLPALVAGWYLWTRAADQYASHVGLTVQRGEAIDPAELMGGLALPLGGQGPRSDTDILHEYLRSPALVATLADRLDLRAHYAAPHARDPVFALAPDATLGDLVDHWWRIVHVRYDDATGLIDLRVQAFAPDMAQRIAREILAEATRVISDLSAQARADAVRFATEDVERAQARLRDAREALIAFQSRSQILDPETDLAGRLAIVTSLQADLAEALIALDGLRETTRAADTRIARAERRVAVIRARIEAERSAMATGRSTAGAATATGGTEGADGEADSYPALIADFERLAAERRHAAEALRDAFVALDAARSEASRQTRYVIAYVAPTRPDAATYPRRVFWLLAVIGAGLAAWFALNIAYLSVRDRR